MNIPRFATFSLNPLIFSSRYARSELTTARTENGSPR